MPAVMESHACGRGNTVGGSDVDIVLSTQQIDCTGRRLLEKSRRDFQTMPVIMRGRFLARDVSRLCYDVSVCLSVRLSVMEVHWRIVANLGFKFRSKFTAHCGRSPQCRSACGRIVVAVYAGKRGGVISRYASHC